MPDACIRALIRLPAKDVDVDIRVGEAGAKRAQEVAGSDGRVDGGSPLRLQLGPGATLIDLELSLVHRRPGSVQRPGPPVPENGEAASPVAGYPIWGRNAGAPCRLRLRCLLVEPGRWSFMLAAVLVIAPVARSTTAAVGLSWQAASLDLPPAWQVTSGSSATVVAVVDSGVQADNPVLQGRVLAGYDFVHGDTNTADDNGHGTAVAGIIAAVCPGCSILPVKVLAANGTGDWATISAGIVWAADHGAQVINLSVGAPHALDVVGAAVARGDLERRDRRRRGGQ